jgi:CHAT domain-containing protein
LIDRFAFIRLPSVSALLLPKKDGQLPWTREFEGYGDPLLDGPPRRDPAVYTPKRGTDGLQLADVRFLKQLAPLKGSRRELVDMADIFPAGATAIHLGAQATEAGVKGNAGLGGSRIVSFATHGLLPTQVAGIEEPGLVLTPPGKPSLIDDGMLTASEVTQLRLSADMVILSACNTASAEHDRAGDSMSSLSRAFLFAGAGSLLASHWRVSDDSTVALMTEMLRLRRADPTLTRAKALQQAMRTVRIGRRADGSAIEGWQDYWAHPSAWAAFSLIANGDE